MIPLTLVCAYWEVEELTGGTYTAGIGLNWGLQYDNGGGSNSHGVGTIGGELWVPGSATDSHAPSGVAGGDLTGNYPNPTLAAIVAASTVGDATHVPRVTWDAKGRITAVSSVAISGAGIDTSAVHSGDAAGGSLSGTYPNPTLSSTAVVAISGGTLFTHFADASNSTTVETDLYSDTLTAGQLSVNGQRIEYEVGGVFVSSATATRQVKMYFGGTAIFDTGALTLSLSAAWTMYAVVMRVSASVVRYFISFTTEGAALAAYTATGELTGLTLGNTQVVKVTAQSAGVGAASADITARLGSLSFRP